jgi:hypothetical protein
VKAGGDESCRARPAPRKIFWRDVTRAETCIRCCIFNRCRAFHHRVIASASALEGTLPVMGFPRTVDADGEGKAVLLKKAPVVIRQQRAIGGDRESDVRAAPLG